MEMNMGRALFGYKMKEVENKIALINQEFEEANHDYYRQLTGLRSKNEDLRRKLEAIQEQISDYKNLRNEILDILYNGHIEAFTSVYEVMKKNQQMEKYKIDILDMQKKKYSDLTGSIKGFLSQVQNITSK